MNYNNAVILFVLHHKWGRYDQKEEATKIEHLCLFQVKEKQMLGLVKQEEINVILGTGVMENILQFLFPH